jgi:large subunit ribosomal protein L28
MSNVCQVTGKRPSFGRNVSHANNKTNRVFQPNIQVKRFWVDDEGRWVRLKVSTHGMKIIDTRGIGPVLREMRARGERV